MDFSRLAARAAGLLLGFGGAILADAATAAETYSMAKHWLCKPSPETGEMIISTLTYTAFSQDGMRVAVASEDRKVHVCETAGGNEIALLAVPSALDEDDEAIHFAAFSADGARLVTASRDGMARIWDIAANRELAALAHPSPVHFAAFSPDGARLVTSIGDAAPRLWDVESGRELAGLQHPSPVRSAVFSPDGAGLVTASLGGTAHTWNTADGSEIAALAGHAKQVSEARYSPDGTRVVTASDDGTARIWDAASGRELLVVKHETPVSSAAFSMDGSRIVTGAGNEAHVVDAGSGEAIAVLKGHEDDVLDAAFSPDGSRLATASGDGSVRVWDAGSAEQLAVLTGHLGAATFVTFGLDGQRILSSDGPQGIIWTRMAAASLPEGAVGLWFNDFGTPEQTVPPEVVRTMCVTSPIKIDRDGLVVFYEVMGETEPPRSSLHMRCGSDLACQIFAGEPGQAAEPQATGSLAFSTETGDSLCLAGECRPIARCPAVEWTAEERASGFAAAWEKVLVAPRE